MLGKGCQLAYGEKPYGFMLCLTAYFFSLKKDTDDVAIDVERIFSYVSQLHTVCLTIHVLPRSVVGTVLYKEHILRANVMQHTHHVASRSW